MKYYFNRDYFGKIDTQEKAYWLGFIYADGYVNVKKNTLKIALQKRDGKLLNSFKSSLGLKKSLYIYNDSLVLTVYSKKILDDLNVLGVFQTKSLLLTFPNRKQVPQKLLKHFIRGYFDGDGCVFKGKNWYGISFLGTKEFLTDLKKALKINNKVGKKGNVFSLQNNKKSDLLRIYSFMYKKANVWLPRKRKKFEQFTKHYNYKTLK